MLRRLCSVYHDFVLYCSTKNIKISDLKKDKGVTPQTISRRLLASPELASATKLCPLSPLSQLNHLTAGKDYPTVRQMMTSLKPKPVEQQSMVIKFATEPLIGNPDEDLDKTPKATGIFPYIKKAQRTPYIDSTKLVPSPVINTEGVRRTTYEPSAFSICSSNEATSTTDSPIKEATKESSGKNSVISIIVKGPSTIKESLPEKDSSNNNNGKESDKEAAKSQGPGKCSSIILCSCGNECKDGCTECESCAAKIKTYSGFLYENKFDNALKRKWYKLIGSQLYRITSLPYQFIRI